MAIRRVNLLNGSKLGRMLVRAAQRLCSGVAAAVCVSPLWAQSDPQILFTSTRDDRFLPKIYVMDDRGGNVRRVGSLPGRHERPQFSADNRRILFAYAEDISAAKQIYVMNSDGSDPQALTGPPGANSAPLFASDGRIVYSRALGSGPPFSALYVMDADGGHKAPFSIGTPEGMQPDALALGPRGMAAFTTRQFVTNEFLQQIFTLEGGRIAQLTHSPENFGLPGWCLDGSKIAYVNTGASFFRQTPRHERDGVYVMNADGSNPTRIVEIDFSRRVGGPTSLGIGPGWRLVELSAAPSFSRDCRSLTFAVNLDGTYQVYIVNSDGSRLRRLTEGPGDNAEPSFSH
jgi:Tol biopolymer transport system component